jgi:hypothetical protein
MATPFTLIVLAGVWPYHPRMKGSIVRLVACAVGGMLVACSSGAQPQPPQAAPETTGSAPAESTPPSPAGAGSAGGCRGNGAIPGAPSAGEEPLSGDVDGDGRADTSFLIVDPAEPIGCRALLVVITASRSEVLTIDREDMTFEFGLPALLDLRQIDGRPGLEPVVDLLTGASTVLAGVFSMGSGPLRQLRVEGGDPLAGDLFSHGGSIGHLDAADCAGSGTVVVSSAQPAGALYVVDRHFYTFRDGALRLAPSRNQRLAVELGRLPQRFGEFASTVFSSCPLS